MNLGCGTLIALLVLVFLAGKIIPHGPTASPPPHGAPAVKGRGTPDSVISREKTVKPLEKLVQEPVEPSFESVLSDLKSWIDEKAQEAQNNVMERAALPSGSGPAAEVLAKAGEEAKTLLSQRIADAVASSAATSQSAPAEKVETKPTPTPLNPVRPGVPGATGPRLAVEGRDPVFNNPWNHAVEPVERYLKQHVHDAASIELLEWGQVEVTRDGYEVRCVYKSKNVLGKMATQSRLFVLDHAGRVTDIRD